MENKIYTAEELRAESAELVDMLGEHNTAASMLRYAANLVERCERIKIELPFDAVINTANYILRGDAKNENK